MKNQYTDDYYCYVCADLISPPHTHQGTHYRKYGEKYHLLKRVTFSKEEIPAHTPFFSQLEVEEFLAKEIGGL